MTLPTWRTSTVNPSGAFGGSCSAAAEVRRLQGSRGVQLSAHPGAQGPAPATKRETPLAANKERFTSVVSETDGEASPQSVQTIRIYFWRVERAGHK